MSSTTQTQPTEAQAIITALKDLYGHQIAALTDPRSVSERTNPDTIPVAVIPEGLRLQSLKPLLDEYATAPDRRTGTFIALDAASLIAHAIRFKSAESALFANPAWNRPTAPGGQWQLPTATAVYNYHHPSSYPGTDKAGWGDHIAVYSFGLSEPFKAWAAMDGEPMGQTELAEFLETRCLDIAPAPIVATMAEDSDFDKMVKAMTTLLQGKWAEAIDLMEMARTIRINESAVAEQTTDTKGGTGGIRFSTEHHTDTGEIFSPPDLFMLSLPIFDRGEKFSIPVRLKYRLQKGRVIFFYQIFRLDLAFELAFREACQTIADKSGLPLILGIPE